MTFSRRNFLKLSATAMAAYCLKPTQILASNEAEDILFKSVKRIKGEAPVTLRILHPQGSLENIRPCATSFTKKSGIEFEFIETPVDNINTKIFIDHARGENTFDIALPATFAIPDLVEAGSLAELTEYSNEYEQECSYTPSLYDLGDFFNGKFYGYQTDGDIYMMFFKKSALQNTQAQKRFEDYHGRPLTTPKTWAEIDDIMEFFHDPDNNQYGGCLFRTPQYTTWEWWSRFYEGKLRPFTKDMQPNIANDHGIGALEDLIKATESQHPSSKMNSLFQNWKLYAQGNCIVNIGWGGTQKHLNQPDKKIHNDIVHTPTPDGGFFNWGWNYIVSSSSKHQHLAYLYTLYATMPQTSNVGIYAKDGFFDPYRTEHYTDPNIEETYGKNFLTQHKKAITDAIPDLYLSARQEYIRTLNENIILACKGAITAEEALTITAHNWDEITDKQGRKNQTEQWSRLSEKYPARFG